MTSYFATSKKGEKDAYKKLQHLAAYYELYELVADTKNTQAQIKMYLINEADVPELTARRNIKGFVEDEASMVTVDAKGAVTIKKEEIEALLKMLSELFTGIFLQLR